MWDITLREQDLKNSPAQTSTWKLYKLLEPGKLRSSCGSPRLFLKARERHIATRPPAVEKQFLLFGYNLFITVITFYYRTGVAARLICKFTNGLFKLGSTTAAFQLLIVYCQKCT